MKRWLLLALVAATGGLTGCVTLDPFDGGTVCEYRRELPRPELEQPVFAEAAK